MYMEIGLDDALTRMHKATLELARACSVVEKRFEYRDAGEEEVMRLESCILYPAF